MNDPVTSRKYLLALALGALGVVYGDIGTSPLYALRECFHGPHAITPAPAHVLGVLSLILWALISIVSIKYLGLLLRADNKGEGGILALLALAFPEKARTRQNTSRKIIFLAGLFGAALLYGDGMITPAISVLSAVEGLKIATPFFEPFIVPITLAILILLFSIQRFGTGNLGKIFGALTLTWFLALAGLGLKGIFGAPQVILAFNPLHAASFLLANGTHGFLVLGSVFLVVTGAEALYADMGHFGKRAVRQAWFALVLPALVLNYLGQGALLLRNPAAAENPFYLLAPTWALYPLVVLATLATAIASQALIAGAFSLTMQAVQLGLLPRFKIEHTSSREKGQIYIPQINWLLMLACILLVIAFGSSANLASAYGIAVSMTMLITTILFSFAARRLWQWSPWKTILICAPLLLLEAAFFAANALKIAHGGWVPLLVAIAIFTLLTTWKTGRAILAGRLENATLPLEPFLPELLARSPARVQGTAIYLAGRAGIVPLALMHNLKHNKVLHERVVFLTIRNHPSSHLEPADRLQIEDLQNGFFRIIGNYGFMEEPDVPALLRECGTHGLSLQPDQCTYFLGKETVIPRRGPGMALWREQLFAMMTRNATSAAAYFKLPPNRVVELGMQVEL